jgi:periplasmic protein TonB
MDMAYADQRSGIDPKSLSVTVAVNGGILAALLLLGSAATVINDPPMIVENWANPATETPPPPATKERAKPSVVIVPKTYAPPRTTSENELTPPILPPLTGGTGTGTIIEFKPPVIELPKITPPVIVFAKRDPRYARDFQPDYPPGMIRAGIEGSVTVRVLVGVDGRVKSVEAVRADQDDFLNATRAQALKRWRFTPATRDGAAYESWQQLTVRFQMPT